MTIRTITCAAILLLGALSVACSDDDKPESTATPVPATATATATSEAIATPVPPTTPISSRPIGERPLTIWLIEVPSGSVTTLYEKSGQSAWAQFSNDGTRALVLEYLTGGSELTEYDLDGVEAGRSMPASPCVWQEVEIDGATHADFQCKDAVSEAEELVTIAILSPDRLWIPYQVRDDTPTPVPFGPPGYDQWALNIRTGERRLLQAAMQHCGGCDFGGSGGGWSPSGRYLVFGENGPQLRLFLSDFETGTTVELESPENLWPVLQWAPHSDLLLRPAADGVVLHDVRGGTTFLLEGVMWPAAFDANGRFVYSPSPAFGGPGDQFSTTIADSSTGQLLAEFDGAARYSMGRELSPVVITVDGEIVAALDYAGNCDGTTIYARGQAATCIEHASGSTVSPDGSTVALARITRPDPSVPQQYPFDVV